MNNNEVSVPYVFESSMARLERANRRMWVLCIIMFVSLMVSNCCWIWYESQWEDVVTTQEITQDVTQDSGDDGYNNFVGGDAYSYTESEADY